MLKRNAPVLAFMLVFAAVLYFVYSVPRYEPVVDVENVPPAPPVEGKFVGRVIMPSIDEIYVLENTAGRDLNRLAQFLQGRAAGLHYLSTEYFKKIKPNHKGRNFFKSEDDVILGLRLTLDSLGRFMAPQVMFSDADNAAFQEKVLKHIEYFWRLPPSAQGKLEIWIPVRFHAGN